MSRVIPMANIAALYSAADLRMEICGEDSIDVKRAEGADNFCRILFGTICGIILGSIDRADVR